MSASLSTLLANLSGVLDFLPHEVTPNLAAVLYLVAGVLFIYALRGLSHPETSRGGNRYGMLGMTIAVLTTLALLKSPSALSWLLIARRPWHRRHHRRHHRAQDPDDADAGTRRGIPLPRRPRGGVRRCRRSLCAKRVRHSQ